MSPGAIDGIVRGGSPTGNGPTTGRPDRVDRSSTADTTVAPTTAIRMPGTVGRQRLTPKMTARDTTPMASATGIVSPSISPSTNAAVSATRPSASTLKPNSLGSWPTITIRAMPLR